MLESRARIPGLLTSLVTLLGIVALGCARIEAIRRDGFGAFSGGRITGSLEFPADGSASITGAGAGPVVVHLHALPGSAARRAGATFELAVRSGRLEPEIAVIAPGAMIHFRNLDRVHHDLFSVAPAEGWRVRLAPSAETTSTAPEQEGFLRAYCRLHPEESFALVLRPAEYVGRVDSGGRFELGPVPSGRYVLRAAGIHGESAPRTLQVARGATVEVAVDATARPD